MSVTPIDAADRYPGEGPDGEFPYSNPDLCRACGVMLLPENRRVADGCSCNSIRGVNHGLVAPNTCTCPVCDPAQTGASRCAPDAWEVTLRSTPNDACENIVCPNVDEIDELRDQLTTMVEELEEARKSDQRLRVALGEWRLRAERIEAERDRLHATLADVRAEAERLIAGAVKELNCDVDREALEDYERPSFDLDMAYHEGIECAAVNLRDRTNK